MELQIRGVSKTYANGVQALKEVSLTIPKGMYGLLGPNGAGKSTLMRILATLQEPDEGSVQLGGVDVLHQKDEVRKTLGYLPQEFGVSPKVSAASLLDHSRYSRVSPSVGRVRRLQYLLHDLFEANTFWELETPRATALQTAAGAWQVTLDVRARKVVVDEAGAETELPMDDWIDIGVFAPSSRGDALTTPLYLQKHHITSRTQAITLTVPSKPAHAGIDPHNLLIDWETDDNVTAVRVQE